MNPLASFYYILAMKQIDEKIIHRIITGFTDELQQILKSFMQSPFFWTFKSQAITCNSFLKPTLIRTPWLKLKVQSLI